MMKQRQTNKYKRLNKTDKDSDDYSSDDEETELFVRNKSPKREVPSIEKNIEDGDTLQSLAIRYHCTIEDLKRLNNIHKENEIFARITIKVPHRPFSEALAAVHVSGRSSPINSNEPATSRLIDIDHIETNIIETSDISEVNQIIFNSNISSSSINCDKPNSSLDNEDVSLLPNLHRDSENDPVISKLSCNGSDWDISYPALIVCIVLVIFAIPLVYVFYIAEHLEKYHNHTHVNGS